ncbi:hypothetical protein CAL7716_064930 [Calothrix sp. PCC 7716]|nr:hypothetical protein CAL7716_064930 [Calothrix sp. PCC 7716]
MLIDGRIKWNFLSIHKKFQKQSFDCGYAILNDSLNKYAFLPMENILRAFK